MKVTKEGVKNFEWPEFNSESQRLKAYSTRFRGKSIINSFNSVYNKNLVEGDKFEETPRELKVGDIIKTKIVSFGKNLVTLETPLSKKPVISKINLTKYKNFKSTDEYVDAAVTMINKDHVYVDFITPMINNWVDSVIKNRDSQYELNDFTTYAVKNLQLTKGGYIGDITIKPVSDFLNQEFTMKAFIPGSQIVLNIEYDFNKWVGKTVQGFITNKIKNDKTGEDMIVVSPKLLYEHIGNINKILIYTNSEGKYNISELGTKKAVVTGVIHSSKKCGVFVEVPEWYITGMINVDADKLVEYKPGMKLDVKLSKFVTNTYYNSATEKYQTELPYLVKDHILEKCNLKPIFDFA